jgi:uncharacterized membrane protein
MNANRIYALGLLLVFVGFGLVAIGGLGSGSGSFGGVVFIGPFPIAFGSGSDPGLSALTAVIIGAVMVVSLYLWALMRRPRSQDGS